MFRIASIKRGNLSKMYYNRTYFLRKVEVLRNIVIFLVIFFAGCAGELSMEAQRVLVVNEKPNDCANIGQINAGFVDASGAMSYGAIRQKAQDDLREKVAKLGGDAAYVLEAKDGWNYLLGGYENTIKAEVYKCDSVAESAVDSAKNVDFGAESMDSQNKNAESAEFVE